MMAPSPIGWKTLKDYYENGPGKRYFSQPAHQDPEMKRYHVISWTRLGYTKSQIHTATGYSVSFINDTLRRFAAKCVLETAFNISNRHTERNLKRKKWKISPDAPW